MLLSEYDIQYRAQKAIKGSVLADHLASQPINDDQSLQDDFPDEEIMYLKSKYYEEPLHGEGPDPESRWGLIFDGAVNAYGRGIGAVIVMPRGSHVPFTTRLMFDYTNNTAEDYARKLLTFFNKVEFHHIPREENQMANALATLASMYQVKSPNEAPQITITRLDKPAHVFAAEVVTDDKPWFYDIKIFLQKEEYPPGASIKDRRTLRRLSGSFFLTGDVLYKMNFDMVLLRCVDRHEANQLIYVIKCHKSQIYAGKIHVPPTLLNVISSPWPFSLWGIDMIEMIEPKASNGHRIILVTIDYFTKWVEVASYATVTRQVMMKELCGEFKIEHHNSSPYRPKMNGAVEAANNNIKNIVQKMVVTYKD
ncbi:uncharacterized protein LOC131633188 [Vicia villosa]|uniref:uncharacterized protein LOC131633188 n=1 Tax=Vicia villosa TaxID=3911 RepID=UPI00273AD8E1|nr:uncharacterized protein LOC131633188 [Vicia villosa]